MFIEPNSHIKIYRGVESSGKRRPIFKTRANQTAYFNSKLVYDYAPTTNVKYTMSKVRVSYSVAQLMGCNYISFINPNFGNKVYYANVIGDPVYVNNDCSELTYAIDYFQTDMFDVTLEPCYNLREQLTDEDYTKSVSNPFDASIAEFWTSEPLPVSKDLEKNYIIDKDQTAECFYAAESIIGRDGNINMTLVAVPHLNPPNAEEETWLQQFVGKIVADESQYGLVYINGDNLSNPQGGFHFSAKILEDLFNDIVPDYGSKINPTYDMFICETKPVISSADNYIWGYDGLMQHLSLWSNTNGSVINSVIAVHEMPLYMIGAMFMSTEGVGESYSREFINVETPNVSTRHNKKLARFPFSYIRVETPSGDTKEFQFERFDLGSEYLEKAGTAQFDMNMDYNCQPEFSLIPMWYKNWGRYAGIQNYTYNFSERIAFQAIPQMPYSTDAFLAGLAAANADILSNRTVEQRAAVMNAWANNEMNFGQNTVTRMIAERRLGRDGSVPYDMPTDMASVAGSGSVGGGIGTVAGIMTGKTGLIQQDTAAMIAQNQNIQNRNMNNFRQQMMEDASNLAFSTLESNSVVQNQLLTKELYACDRYVPGSGTGVGYYNDHAFLDFIVTRVSLRDSILALYDQWFSNYGYTSNRFGAPRIMAYLTNSATGKPHFAPSGAHNVTYVQTQDAAVKAPSKTSEQFWEAMLNAGIQFIRGEDLIPATP